MRRLTLSVADDLAETFDRLVADKGYDSEAFIFSIFCQSAARTRGSCQGHSLAGFVPANVRHALRRPLT